MNLPLGRRYTPEKPKLFIGVPMHDRPTAHFTVSIIRAMPMLWANYDVAFDPPIQVSNLAKERNLILAKAIEWGADKLLFIDDDIVFQPEQVLQIVETEGDVVGAVYRTKEEKLRHTGYELEKVGRPGEKDGHKIGMAALGMGFTAINCAFVKAMIEKGSFSSFQDKSGRSVPSLFEFKMALDTGGDVRFLGEDEVFCKHIIDAGGKLWAREDVVVGHVGSFVYR